MTRDERLPMRPLPIEVPMMTAVTAKLGNVAAVLLDVRSGKVTEKTRANATLILRALGLEE